MKTRTILLLLCAVFVVGTVFSAGAAVPGALHYKVHLKSPGIGDMGTREVWVKGGLMRCDIKSAKLPLTILKNPKGVFLLHAWNKVAGQYPEGSPRGNVRALLPGPTGSPKIFLEAMKAKRENSEKVGKQTCDVYSYTDPTTKRFCKLWVDTKSGQPVKLWLKGEAKKASEVTATYVLFKEGEKVADSFFEVPKGYAIRPMPKRELPADAPSKKTNSDKLGV